MCLAGGTSSANELQNMGEVISMGRSCISCCRCFACKSSSKDPKEQRMCMSLLSYNLIFILCPASQRWQKSNPITPGSDAFLLPGWAGGKGAYRVGWGMWVLGPWWWSAWADISDIQSPCGLVLVTPQSSPSLVPSYKASQLRGHSGPCP